MAKLSEMGLVCKMICTLYAWREREGGGLYGVYTITKKHTVKYSITGETESTQGVNITKDGREPQTEHKN